MFKPIKSVVVLLVMIFTGTASGAMVSIDNLEAESDPVEAPIVVKDARNLGCGELNISYDPSVVHVTGASKGDIGVVTHNYNNEAGWVYVNTFGTGVSGNVTFASLKLKPVDNGESELNVSVISLFNISYKEVNYTVSNGEIAVSSLDTGSGSSGGGGGGGGGSTFMLQTTTPSSTPTTTPADTPESNISMLSIPPTSSPNKKEEENETEDQLDSTPTPTPSRVLSGPQITIIGGISAVLLLVLSYILLRRRG